MHGWGMRMNAVDQEELPGSLDACVSYLTREEDAHLTPAEIGHLYMCCVASMGRTRLVYPLTAWNAEGDLADWERIKSVQRRKHNFQYFTFTFYRGLVLLHWVDKYDHDMIMQKYPSVPDFQFGDDARLRNPKRQTIESGLCSLVDQFAADMDGMAGFLGECVITGAREYASFLAGLGNAFEALDNHLYHEYDAVSRKINSLLSAGM